MELTTILSLVLILLNVGSAYDLMCYLNDRDTGNRYGMPIAISTVSITLVVLVLNLVFLINDVGG